MFYLAVFYSASPKANDKPALAAHRVATYKKRSAEYLAYETEIQEENIYNNATV